jgi:hypothetical protein
MLHPVGDRAEGEDDGVARDRSLYPPPLPVIAPLAAGWSLSLDRLGCFVPGSPLDEEVDLTGVVGLVLADVEPFAEVIGGSPVEGLVDGAEEPGVVALFELGEGFGADLCEDVEVVLEGVALDGGAAFVAEVHGGVPTLLDVGDQLSHAMPSKVFIW